MSRQVTAEAFGRGARGVRALFLASSAFLLASCLGPAPHPETARPPPARVRQSVPAPVTVVLVAIDGVRWQEVFRGVDPELADRQRLSTEERPNAETLMPNVHGLARNGGLIVGAPGSGAGVFASGPEFLSLPGYAEMLTGRSVSGCKDNGCARTLEPTLADEVAALPGARREDVAVVTSWPDIGRIASHRPDRLAMSTGRSGGPTRSLFRRDPVNAALVDEAAVATTDPGVGDFRPDRYTARIALRYLETEKPRFLFVSLGEPDEYAHRDDYRGYLAALKRADLAVGEISQALSEQARAGARTVLLVTADHGRATDFKNHGAAHPESARVWLLAWGTEIDCTRGLVAGDRRLADLAPTLRGLLGIPEDRDPFAGHPIPGLFKARPG